MPSWHRTIGIITALFAVMLAVTGLFLNHTERLQLDSRYLESSWLLDWYDMEPAQAPVAYPAGDHWISRIDQRLYFDDRELGTHAAGLAGAVLCGDLILAAADDGLILLTETGELVEVMTAIDGVPAGIQRIGTGARVCPVVQAGEGVFAAEPDLEAWSSADAATVGWSRPQPLPSSLSAALLRLYRGQGLSLEKLIVDIHSGRILGGFGVILVDLAAVMFVFLSVSGSWAWIRRKKSLLNGNGR